MCGRDTTEQWPVRAAQQRRLLFEELARSGLTRYRPANLVRAIRFRRPIDRSLVREALTVLVAHHAQLRSRFERRDRPVPVADWVNARRFVANHLFDVGLYTQLVTDAAIVPIVERHLHRLPEHYDEDFCRALAEELSQPFDYRQPPLLRAVLWATRSGEGVLACIVPHLVADGISLDLIARDTIGLYRTRGIGALSDAPPGSAYHEWVCQEWRSIGNGEHAAAVAFWGEQWRAWQPHVLTYEDVGLSRRATARGAHTPIVASLVVDPPLATAVRDLASREKTTAHVLVRTALYIALAGIARRDAVVGWCNYANRTPRTTNVVGWFANRHIIAADCSGRRSGRDVLKDVHRAVVQLARFGACPLNALWDHLQRNLEFDSGTFEVGLDFRTRHPEPAADGLETLALANMRPPLVDLDVRVVQDDGRFRVDASCAAEGATDAWLSRVTTSFLHCLTEMTRRPEALIDAYRT